MRPSVVRLIAVVGLAGAFGLIASASAAVSSDILIRPGLGIGKLRLGMLEADARKAYPYAYLEREARPFGRQKIRMSFGLAPYTAVLYGPTGRTRVVSIQTLSPRERTREGLGIGTKETKLRAVYGKRLQCVAPHTYDRSGTTMYESTRPCYLRTRSAETFFRLEMNPDVAGLSLVLKYKPDKALVTHVGINTLPLPK